MKILINAANLHNGGGVQVASSFINELEFKTNSIINSFEVFVSSEVDKNINQSVRNKFKKYKIYNIHGLRNYKKNFDLFNNYDLVFTIFGPCYYNISGINIVGFAQPWIIYPNNECYAMLSTLDKFKYFFKFFLQKKFFKISTYCIVELEHVKKRLIDLNIFEEDKIYVVHNTVSNIYFNSELWESVYIESSRKIKIGLISRDYFHKNIDIIPQVKEILKNKYKQDVNFYVTLNKGEWLNKSSYFKENVINIGPLRVNQCPSFYEEMDAIFFPSFLECFSATPLEAMIMKKPLFASERRFIKDVCSDFAFYFEPSDPESAALVIHNFILNKDNSELNSELLTAQEYAKNFSSAQDRAAKYLQIIENCMYK